MASSSLYTAQGFEPEDLIRADFEVQQARVSRLMRATMMDGGDTARIWAEVEAALPLNCEHVVPQSWFAKAEPMRGDLHHLFACESRCNSFRGNTALAEFPDFPQQPTTSGVRARDAVRGDCGKSQSGGFEPANGKGAAARATCYFRLRYPALISADEMPEDRWEAVSSWHEQDPVTIWERHRNAAIFERQGNPTPSSTTPSGCSTWRGSPIVYRHDTQGEDLQPGRYSPPAKGAGSDQTFP